MLKKYSLLFALTTFMVFAPLTAQYDADSKEFALAKAAIEGLTNYAKTTNKEQVKRHKIRTRSFKTSKIETMLREAFDLTCDYGVNMALDAMGGKTLCDGKGPNAYPINLHKALSIVIVETAKLLATEKLAPRKLMITIMRKLVEKPNIGLGKTKEETVRNQNIILALGLTAAALTQEFYDDLEAGTVDWTEFKKAGGKYRTLEGSANAYLLGKLAGKTGDIACGKATWMDKFGMKDLRTEHLVPTTKYFQKYLGDLMLIPLKHLLFAATSMASVAIEHPAEFKKAISI